ncbi:MAG: cupin domain-containing protein [Synechococcus sp. ELA057]
MDALALIDRYGLQAHPEGGWYREMHRSSGTVIRADQQQRSACTTILFLLQRGEISRWHRVSQADESWHFHAGEPLELLVLPPLGGPVRRLLLGVPHADSTLEPLAVVPADCWQAARSLGSFSLVSCSVAPGFTFADFTLMRDLPRSSMPSGVIAELL